MVRIYAATDRGPVRPMNEDCFGIDERLQLCVIADGMGGHNAGDIASRLAVDAVIDHVRAEDRRRSGSPAAAVLRRAVELANVRILESARAARDLAGMGTTLVAAVLRQGMLSVAHAGDSRLYLYSRGALRQMTEDDSWVTTVLARQPDVDPVALRTHTLGHVLNKVVGVRPIAEVHVAEEPLNAPALAILTTDGVHGAVDRDQLLGLADEADAAELPEMLVRTALALGSRDNCTAVVAEYTPLGW
jgi:protein phosphatase